MTRQETTDQRIQSEASLLPQTRFGKIADELGELSRTEQESTDRLYAKYPWLEARVKAELAAIADG